ncbi:hypothetical protein WICPIJ_002019 [Wickerhamomyces pijperi]|uniref:SWI5-dependent HO expression protein 3 n=1 Tax=Wickerhamomyces pijperi TaxID=599730 RepID=A0A9P8QCN9_WICPI|nr:hypothetical protein WICPIJ_002019 [Wickerhamomyces pijperi]
MPPQFFKDASSGGLTNKFKPRTFSFSFGKANNGTATPSPNTSVNDLSYTSDDLPKSSSTAATSINQTRFFLNNEHGFSHNKTTQQFNAKNQEDFLSDSSIDNMEQLVRNLRADHQLSQDQSTPTKVIKPKDHTHVLSQGSQRQTRSKKAKASLVQSQRKTRHGQQERDQHPLTDDEPVEILDIRDLSTGDMSSGAIERANVGNESVMSEPSEHERVEEQNYQSSYSQRSDEANDNYLLEALSKSQKMCNGLKQKLELANSKVATLNTTIGKQSESIESLKAMVSKFQEDFADLQNETETFKKSKQDENQVIKETKAGYDDLLKSFNVYKSEIAEVKKKLDHLKQIKQSSAYELSKKNKDVLNLQQKLDETSGFLSEQKIKTTELEKNLDKSRKDYDKKILESLKSFKELESKIELTLKKGFEDTNSNIT